MAVVFTTHTASSPTFAIVGSLDKGWVFPRRDEMGRTGSKGANSIDLTLYTYLSLVRNTHVCITHRVPYKRDSMETGRLVCQASFGLT